MGIILAAGGSARLGRPKQLVQWGNELLLERAVRIVTQAGCAPVVVLGSAAAEINSACSLARCNVVVNPVWRTGMGSSLRVGVEAAIAMNADAAVLLTCDQPAVDADHIRRLVAAGAGSKRVASAYAGRKGVPAYLPASSLMELRTLEGDEGARSLLREALTIDLTFGELDVDTEEDLQRARELLLPQRT